MKRKTEIELLSPAHNALYGMFFRNEKSVDSLVEYIGKDDAKIETGFTDDVRVQSRIIISGRKSFTGYSTVVKPGDWVIKVWGYIDPSNNKETYKCMVMSDLMVKTLFNKGADL